MAAEEEINSVEITPVKGGGRKKLVLVLLLSSLIGGLGGIMVVKTFLGKAPPAQDESPDEPDSDDEDNSGGEGLGGNDPGAEDDDAPPDDAPPSSPKELEKFTVNLNEPGAPRYLVVTVALKLDKLAVEEEIDERSLEIKDLLSSYFSSLRERDTRGESAREEMKTNIQRRLNNTLRSGRVSQVLLPEFLVR
ncbi:MAG: hypothetical protein CMH54_00435 [Myxococcales bacterium]|nr:hypothetical protein [Myxococcales bacterium]|tara:strand:- start:183 stop:758 length:576 start_codon:yes stop_codon:yes gene_type:complete